MTVVVGTAGHIDHGKTTLLRVLTGIDADRLPEERERGMTIDVGYAHLDLDDGTSIDFVDVPGHAGLVGNMLVGAGEIDAAMVVVAADDGPRAQTLEHLELLDALEIRDGVAVVTKADLVSMERLNTVREELAALVGRTTLGAVPVLTVSAATGAGLDELRAELTSLRDRIPARDAALPEMRFGIDRVFSVRGRGVVVTGTLRGEVSTGDAVTIEPGSRAARVREVQVHGKRVRRSAGGRTALNLAGIESADVHRGDVVVAHGAGVAEVAPTDRLLVELRAPVRWSEGGRVWTPPKPGDHVRLHAGTVAVEARVKRRSLPIRDVDAYRILHLETPIALAPADRFALRAPAPVGTVAAGRVLDVSPPRGPARSRASAARLLGLREAPDRDAHEAARLELHGYLAGPRPRLAADVLGMLETAAIAAVQRQAESNPASSGMPLGELRRTLTAALRGLVAVTPAAAGVVAENLLGELVAAGRLVRSGDRVRAPGTPSGPTDQLAAAMDRLEAALAVPAPPSLAEAARDAGCPPEGIAELARNGRIVRLEPDLAWAGREFERLAAVALAHARREPLTPAAFRDSSGTSRRYVLAILEDLDRRGILQRTPEGHVPGPRAPSR